MELTKEKKNRIDKTKTSEERMHILNNAKGLLSDKQLDEIAGGRFERSRRV